MPVLEEIVKSQSHSAALQTCQFCIPLHAFPLCHIFFPKWKFLAIQHMEFLPVVLEVTEHLSSSNVWLHNYLHWIAPLVLLYSHSFSKYAVSLVLTTSHNLKSSAKLCPLTNRLPFPGHLRPQDRHHMEFHYWSPSCARADHLLPSNNGLSSVHHF